MVCNMVRYGVPQGSALGLVCLIFPVVLMAHILFNSRQNTRQDKTEVPHAARPNHTDYIVTLTVSPCAEVKDLGLIIDSCLSFEAHVDNRPLFQLRNIAWVKYMMSVQNVTRIVPAFATSRLDYCNAILSGCYITSTSYSRMSRLNPHLRQKILAYLDFGLESNVLHSMFALLHMTII